MSILKADRSYQINDVTIQEYLLTKHNPNHIAMPSASMEGKVLGVTIHNTNTIQTSKQTTEAEQYTRATVNGNMKDVRVHFYVDNNAVWQNLPLHLSGWHATDGTGDGNRKTIAIECIMSPEYNEKDQKAEDTCAKLSAGLLKKYGLDINSLYTHTYWLNVKDGKKGSAEELNCMPNAYKNCPSYILPHWKEFVQKVSDYMIDENSSVSKNPSLFRVYRIRENKKDRRGSYFGLNQAIEDCPEGYSVYDEQGTILYPLKRGTQVNISDGTLYVSASAKQGKKWKGNAYLYDGTLIKGRYRITIQKEYCGKTPIGQYVTGWVKAEDCMPY